MRKALVNPKYLFYLEIPIWFGRKLGVDLRSADGSPRYRFTFVWLKLVDSSWGFNRWWFVDIG